MVFSPEMLRDIARLAELSYYNQEKINDLFNIENSNNEQVNNEQVNKDENRNSCVLKNCNCPILFSSDKDCQVYVCKYNNNLAVCFRGTESIRDALTDLNIIRVKMEIPNLLKKEWPKVHFGFLNQFNTVKDNIDNKIKEYVEDKDIEDKNKNIIFNGHSLGGGLSTLASVYFGYKYPNLNIHCVTFGSPRVGSPYFIKLFDKVVDESYRFVNDNDPVPLVPAPLRFRHVRGCKWLYQDQVLNESSGWRWWRFIKNTLLSITGMGYNALNDHKCAEYISDLDFFEKDHL